MLTENLSILDGFQGLLENKLFSDYIFPVFSGVYLTFLTARVIQFADSRREATRRLERIPSQIAKIPLTINPDSLKWIYSEIAIELEVLGQEFRARGHTRAADLLQNTFAEVLQEMLDGYTQGKVRHGRFFTGDPMTDPPNTDGLADMDLVLTIRQCAHTNVRTGLSIKIDKIVNTAPNWSVILDTPTFARIFKPILTEIKTVIDYAC